MARFGWASGGYAGNCLEKKQGRSVRQRGGACVSAFALMTSMALGVPILSKRVAAADAPPSLTTQHCSDTDCQNDGSITVTGGDSRASGMELVVTPSGTDNSFSVVNSATGVLDVTSGTDTTKSVAYGQYVAVGNSSPSGAVSGKTVAMRNEGAITTETRLSSGVSANAGSGMRGAITGDSNQLDMVNSGSILSKNYINPTPPIGGTPFGSSISVFGMSVAGTGDSNRIAMTNAAGGRISAQTAGRSSYSMGMFASLSASANAAAYLRNEGVIESVTGGGDTGSTLIDWSLNGANGMRVATNGSTGEATLVNAKGATITVSAKQMPGAFGVLTGDNMAAHGMVIGVAGVTSAGANRGVFNVAAINDGGIAVNVEGKNGYGSGIALGAVNEENRVSGAIENNGVIDVSTDNGTAYGIHVFLGRDKPSTGPDGKPVDTGVPDDVTISNAGIINVTGATAHQLYVTNALNALTGSDKIKPGGVANVVLWNLSPVAAVSEDQKVFAVSHNTTLNLGDGKGKGAALILRTSDSGNNGHDSVAVKDLIANKGGTVTGVIDTVYSGGNVDGQNVADYQATLEGYHDYTNQSVYIDRAWQFNAAGNTMGAVQCATISCGLYSSTQGLGLQNDGTLNLSVTDAVGAGMYANLRTMAGIGNKTVSLLNSGNVDVTADGANGKAYGLYVRLQDNNQTADVSNTGVVTVQGATAHQLYVSGQPGIGGGTANVKTWNLDLYDRSSGSQSVFAVADGATLNFSNTHMMLRPGDVAKGYEDNKKFSVKDMVHNYGSGSQVTGQIGSVSTPLPMLTAAYGRVDQNGADVWNNQWVSLNVDAEKGDGPTVNAGTVDSMQSQIDRVGNLLVGGASGGGIGLGDGDLTSVQMKVYYGNQQRRGVGASVTDSTGAVAYADYEIGEGHTLGWHGGVEYANLRAKSKTLNVNSLSAILGGQGRYNFSDTTYLRGQVSGILSNNNNHFNAFDGSSSKVSTINFGMYGAVYAGYDYKPDENNTITPEIGLSALWSHTPSMDVKYDRSPDLNHTYAAQNYTALYANAGVRWTGGIDINGTLLKPTVMAGVRQTLSDGKVKSAMTFNGNRFDTSITRDRTMGIVDVGVSTTVSTGFDVGLNYRGEYGSNTTNHVGYLNSTIRF